VADTEEKSRTDDMLAFRKMMLRVAAWNTKALDGRTVAALHESGLLQKAQEATLPSDTADILKNPDHPKRVPAPPGPMIFVERDGFKRDVIDSADKILSADRNIRIAAIVHLRRMNEIGNVLGLKVEKILNESQEKLSSEIGSVWRPAAISLYDALESDMLLAIAGLRQSIAVLFDDGLNRYLPKIIRPSVDTVQMMEIHFVNPYRQKDEIKAKVEQLSKLERPFIDCVEEYFQILGHIPLTGRVSLGGFVFNIAARFPGLDIWECLWRWAEKKATPLARYHVCQTFCRNPRYIPSGQAQRLWSEIKSILNWEVIDGQNNDQSEFWRLRCDLARYFVHYIEYLIPGQEGDQSATAAWWLSERIAASVGTNLDFARSLRTRTIEREDELSSFVWHLVHPSGRLSRFRMGSTLIRSIWSLSLQCQLAPLMKLEPPVSCPSAIRQAISGSLLSVFPWREVLQEERFFAFDESLSETVDAWAEHVENKDETAPLSALKDVREKIRNLDDLLEQVSRSAGASEGEEFLVAGAFRAWTYSHDGDFQNAGERILNKEWHEPVFKRSRLPALSIIFEGLNELRNRSYEKLDAQLPQIFAYQAEAIKDDSERQRLMFAFCVMCSVSSATTSAIYRLLRPETRHDFRDLAHEWRLRLLSVQQGVPSWVAARLRPVILALHI